MSCRIDQCSRAVASVGLCRPHWEDQRSTERDTSGSGAVTTNGYRYVSAPSGHPITNSYGRALEHRLVLFDAIGPGVHQCQWCGRDVQWKLPGHPNQNLRLTVDHLNGDRLDNRPENLVPSCRGCNATRDRSRDSLGRFTGRTQKLEHSESTFGRKS